MSCPSWLGGRGNLLGLQLGRQESGVAPHVSCSVLAPSAMSVPVRGSVPALSLVLALLAVLTPALLALALSPALVLTLDCEPGSGIFAGSGSDRGLALAFSLALALSVVLTPAPLMLALSPTLALTLAVAFFLALALMSALTP